MGLTFSHHPVAPEFSKTQTPMNIHKFYQVAALATICHLAPLYSQGDLFLSPTRVVFDGRDLTQEVLLLNTGRDSATFTASFIEYHIDSAGNYLPVTDLEETGLYASRYVRVFPRRFALAPNATQTVRLQYVRRQGMQEGEYRSHLFFRMEAGDQKRVPGMGDVTGEDLSISLTAVYGVTIPVLIREGDLSTDAEISDVRLELDGSNPLLEFNIRRYGKKSAYGDLTVDFLTADRRTVSIATWKGLGIYTSAGGRRCSIPIQRAMVPELREGTLLIRYLLSEGSGGAFSSVELKLP